jgi:hypothetical protein
MDQPGRETDLSREPPTRRSRWPASLFTRATGRHRRKIPLPKRKRHEVDVPVARVVDLTALEGNPTERAEVGLLKLDVEVRPLRGFIRGRVEAPVDSQPGVAMTVVILLGTGAFLGACGLAAGHLGLFSPVAAAVVAVLLFLSPVILYMRLRRKR